MSTGSKVNLALLAGLVGGFLPWKMGIEYLDATVLAPCSLISVMFVSAMPADPRIPRTAAFTTAYSLAVLITGIVVVNANFWHGSPIVPPPAILLAAGLLSFATSSFSAAAAGRLIGRGCTPHEAATRIRGGLLLTLGVWMFRYWIPKGITESIAPIATTRGILLMALLISTPMLLISFRWSRDSQSGMVH